MSPFVREDERLALVDFRGLPEGPPEEEAIEPMFFRDVLPAAFRLENTIGSLLSLEPRPEAGVQNPDFNRLANIEGYEDYAMEFVDADSEFEVDQIKRQIDREREDRKTLQAAGLPGMAAIFAAGFLDPIVLLPVGGAARTAIAGGKILKGALRTAAIGATGATATEAALHQSQLTRTFGESAFAISGATFLSGVMGAALAGISKSQLKNLSAFVERDLDLAIAGGMDPEAIELPAEALARTLDPTNLDRNVTLEAIKGQAAFRGGHKILPAAKMSPMMRVAIFSPFVTSRAILQRLTKPPFFYAKNALGEATSALEIKLPKELGEVARIVTKADPRATVEERVLQWNANLYRAIRATDDGYVSYLRRMGTGPRRETLRRVGDLVRPRTGPTDFSRLTRRQFREEVGRAARRGDVPTFEPVKEIPEIEQTARIWRQEIFEPVKEAAIRAGLLPEDVAPETALSYLTRVWNVKKLTTAAGRREFFDRTKAWLRRVHPELTDNAEREAVARQIYDKLTHTHSGRIPYEPIEIKGVTGLRRRSFSIPDEEIEGFLESDIELVGSYYLRTMAPDVELTAEFGDIDMQKVLGAIDDEFNAKARALDERLKSTAPENLKARAEIERVNKALRTRHQSDVRDLMAMRDRLRGTYGAPDNPNSLPVRAQRSIRLANMLAQGGGFMLSSLPDLARVGMVNGYARTFRTSVLPLVRDFGRLKLAKEELRRAAIGLESILDTRAQSMFDLGTNFSRLSRFEQGLQSAGSRFSLLNLLSPWNTAMKQWAGVTTQARMIETMRALSRLSPGQKLSRALRRDLELLASEGISREDAVRMWRQVEANGSHVRGGFWLANTKDWDDERLIELFRTATAAEVDRIIVTPGVGDRPLWLSTELGKTIGQYKSFAVSSVQRMLVPALQRPFDLATINGIALSIGLGMGVFALKTLLAGKELPSDQELGKWVTEGVDRSGVFGIIFDVNNAMEKVNLGASRLHGGPTASRYAARNLTSAMMGPTLGLGETLATLASSAATGEFRESDIRSMRRLLPYQNLFWARWLFDSMEAEAQDRFAVPARR